MSDRKHRLLRRRRPAVQVELPLTDPLEPDERNAPEALLHWWQRPASVASLAGLAVLLLLVALASQLHARRDRQLATELESRVKTLTLRATTRERSLRVLPNPRSWSADPDARLRWPEPPEMIEFLLPMGYARYPAFAVTIDKADHGRMMVLHRVAPDSNGDLRLAFNSTAFGPGEYRLRLQGYTWRGQRVDAGWVRIDIE